MLDKWGKQVEETFSERNRVKPRTTKEQSAPVKIEPGTPKNEARRYEQAGSIR
jgi:hypothetical protein